MKKIFRILLSVCLVFLLVPDGLFPLHDEKVYASEYVMDGSSVQSNQDKISKDDTADLIIDNPTDNIINNDIVKNDEAQISIPDNNTKDNIPQNDSKI